MTKRFSTKTVKKLDDVEIEIEGHGVFKARCYRDLTNAEMAEMNALKAMRLETTDPEAESELSLRVTRYLIPELTREASDTMTPRELNAIVAYLGKEEFDVDPPEPA